MKNLNFKSILPYLIAILTFVVLSYAYFPKLMEGKIVNQSDISSHVGASKEKSDFNKKTGEETLWTNSMFSGMPTTMIGAQYKGNYLEKIYNYLFVGPRPASYLILAFVSFFLLLLAIGVNVWLSMIGALAFGFCAYNFQIIEVGHNTKMVAIALMPMVLAAMVYAYRKKALLGAVLFGIALSFEINANHPQITYYLAMIVIAYGIARLVIAIRNKTLPDFIKTSCLILLATALGVGTNANRLWSNWEYTQYTMRGGSELQMAHQSGTQSKGGLDKEYATSWSYGIGETANLLIPNFMGGSSAGPLSKNSETYQVLKQGGAAQADRMIQQMPTYWGEQAFTAGPMYMGAISIFLFVLGLVLVRGPMKWWIASVSLLAVLLGWGRHLMWLSDFFFDYVPLYNKFRVPSMILVILQLTIPLLGFYVLNKILKGDYSKKEVIRGFKMALGITLGFCALFLLLPGLAGNFTSPADGQFPEWLQRTLPEDRKSLLRTDALRSIAYILAAAITLWFGYSKKLTFRTTGLILGILVVADMWTIDKRYLNDKHFVTPREFNNNFTLRPVDQQILKDQDPHYRVLDLAVNTFNDSHSSYYHKTIGGYSAAKLQRYQDLIDYHLLPGIQRFASDLRGGSTMEKIDSNLSKQQVWNMLNTKYIILDPNAAPLENRYALGNAWFVDDYHIVETPDEEILSLKTIDPAHTALIDRKFAGTVEGRQLGSDSTDTIRLTSYAPNRLVYRSHTGSDRLALFSEVYYPKGWHAEIDGQPASLLRANYILRGMIVPAGEHTITLRFEPDSYVQGTLISRICSVILLILLIGTGGYYLIKKKWEEMPSVA